MTVANQNQGCLGSLLQFFGLSGQQKQPSRDVVLPYRTRDSVLSSPEISFYHVLDSVVGRRLIICLKVRLSDLFFVARPNENMSYFNQINQKHLDFLLCDPGSMRPVLGIELDDSSHNRADRQHRDDFVDRVFRAAKLPLLHFPVRQTYNTNELLAQIAPFLGNLR